MKVYKLNTAKVRKALLLTNKKFKGNLKYTVDSVDDWGSNHVRVNIDFLDKEAPGGKERSYYYGFHPYNACNHAYHTFIQELHKLTKSPEGTRAFRARHHNELFDVGTHGLDGQFYEEGCACPPDLPF